LLVVANDFAKQTVVTFPVPLVAVAAWSDCSGSDKWFSKLVAMSSKACRATVNSDGRTCNAESVHKLEQEQVQKKVTVKRHLSSPIIMRPSLPRRGPHIASHSVCPSVCLSVRLCPSVRPSRYHYRASRGAT